MGGELVGLRDIGYGGRLSRANRLLTTLALRGGTRITAGCDTALEQIRRSISAKRGHRATRVTWGVDPVVFASGAGRLPERRRLPESGLLPGRGRLQGRPYDYEYAQHLAGSFRVLSVGSLVPVKDQASLLRATASLTARIPGVHLHLVGDGPLRAALIEQAAALGIGDAVTLHGHVPREALAGYYRAAHVLAISSRHEMQPVVALEATLCGLPIAGTPVGLVPELAAELAPIGDFAALAAAIEHAHSRRELDRPINPLSGESQLVGRGPGAPLSASDTADLLTALYASMIQEDGVTGAVYQYRRGADTISHAGRAKSSD
jgi:glycosyltransferase involved in cell wall biosynthesis